MSTEPRVKGFLDDEEQDVVEAIAKTGYRVDKSFLTPERVAHLQKVAKMTMTEERTRISLRVPKSDLSKLKARALQEGVGYQTLINTILHKAVR